MAKLKIQLQIPKDAFNGDSFFKTFLNKHSALPEEDEHRHREGVEVVVAVDLRVVVQGDLAEHLHSDYRVDEEQQDDEERDVGKRLKMRKKGRGGRIKTSFRKLNPVPCTHTCAHTHAHTNTHIHTHSLA